LLDTFGKKVKLIVAIVLLFAMLLVSTVIFLRNAGTWLLISDTVPERLDMVFTFAGENVRDAYSRELMQRFPDAHWLMSDYKEGYSRILRRENYDMSRVSIVDTCKNTLSEVHTLLTWIDKKDSSLLKRKDSVVYVGLVSGPYHMRRIKMMIEKNLPEHQVRFFFLPVPLERYKWTDDMFKKWWKSPVFDSVSSEITKIIYFFLVT
jgi:hypothetical protein